MSTAWIDKQKVVRHYGRRESGATIFDFREPKIDDPYGVVLDTVSWSGGEVALDAGCGGGGYLAPMGARAARVVGLDLTLALLEHTTRRTNAGPLVCGDVTALPFADGTFDKVLSAHMLYVVPDIPAAVREFRRVVTHGGVLLAVTNAERDKAELDDVFVEAGLTSRLEPIVSGSFTLENGRAFLERDFESVEVRVDASSALVVPDAALIVAWADRWRASAEHLLQPGLGWNDYLGNVDRLASERVERDGAFICREHLAVFICS